MKCNYLEVDEAIVPTADPEVRQKSLENLLHQDSIRT